ncbi:hypothetical protein ACEPPN_000921 [Leptodophora sp. 'Broadleaf-Isolate-01']
MSDTSAPLPKRGLYHQLRHNPRLVLAVFVLASCYFNFGYDGSVFGGALAMPAFIKQFGHGDGPLAVLSARDVSIMTAVPTVGSVFGAWISAYCGDKLGRRKTLLIGCVISIIAAAIQTGSSSLAVITVGRLIAYGPILIYLAIASSFQSEIAPSSIRGILVGTSIFFINLASVVTSGINWGTHAISSSFSYRLPLGLQILWPMIIAIGLWFITDSPTFFLINGDDERANQSLRKIRRGYTEEEIEVEMNALKFQAALRAEDVQLSWLELFKGANLRRTLLSMSIGNFQQFSGIAFATNYATIFLTQIGSADPYLLVFGLSLLSLGGSVAGLFIVDWMGRRPLALTSFIIIFIIDVVIGALGFTDSNNESVKKAIAAFSLLFGFFYAAGFGPLTYIVTAEMPTARLRNATASFSILSIVILGLAASLSLPYIANADAANLGAKTYLIFAGWMFCCIILTFFFLPETKDRSPAELDEMFNAGVPARKFKGYKCICSTENLTTALQQVEKFGDEIIHEERIV